MLYLTLTISFLGNVPVLPSFFSSENAEQIIYFPPYIFIQDNLHYWGEINYTGCEINDSTFHMVIPLSQRPLFDFFLSFDIVLLSSWTCYMIMVKFCLVCIIHSDCHFAREVLYYYCSLVLRQKQTCKISKKLHETKLNSVFSSDWSFLKPRK